MGWAMESGKRGVGCGKAGMLPCLRLLSPFCALRAFKEDYCVADGWRWICPNLGICLSFVPIWENIIWCIRILNEVYFFSLNGGIFRCIVVRL